jgi:hypothetical protein
MSEREEFERQFAIPNGLPLERLIGDQRYCSFETEWAFRAWNARPTPDGDAVRVPRGYNLSRDYKRLFQFLLANGKAAGFLRTGDFYDGDVVGISRPKPWTVLIGVRGHSFANVYPFNEEDGRTEEDEFIRACEFAKLEWIEPIAAPSAHCGDREAEAVAWVRRRPDGELTGEILLDKFIEPVRKKSGAWLPLYAAIAAGRREG